MGNKELPNESKLLDKGTKLLKAQEYEKAFECFVEIVKLKKKFNTNINLRIETSYYLGLCALNLQYLNVCKECLVTLKYEVKSLKSNKKLLKYIDELERLFIDVASKIGNKGNHEEALKYFDAILELNKDNIDALYNKGLACYHIKKYEVTKECFVEIYKETNNPFYLINMAQIFYKLNEDDKVFECLQRIANEDSNITFSKALLLRELNKKELSDKCLEQTTKMKITNKSDYIFKSLSYFLLDNNQDAEKIYWNSIKDKTIENSFNYHNSFSPFLNEFLAQNDTETSLYHYTDTGGLKSMLENQKFWVTRADFLNDFTETKYICDIINNLNEKEVPLISDIKVGLDLFYDNKKYQSSIGNDNMRKLIDDNKTNDKKNIYILSMTTDEDSLPMWNNYSNCDGYNIKFDNKSLKAYFKSKDCRNLHGNVNYINRKEKKDIIEFITKIIKSGKDNEVNDNDIKYSIISNLTMVAIFVKHKGFEYEKEYRFAFMPYYWNIQQDYNMTTKNFRIKNNCLIPYIETEFNRNSVKQITMSPTCNELNKTALKEFVEKINFHIEDDNIKKSDIPYRKI